MKAEEIKVKGIRADNGEWVEGYFFIDLENKKPYVMLIKRKETAKDWMVKSLEVVQETVCRFTGLKDKNGVEIYERDKFKYRKHDGYMLPDFIGVVGFKDGSFGYYVITEQSDISNEFHPFSYHEELQEDFLDHIEVIGNIHVKERQKQALIDMMRLDEEAGLYDEIYDNQTSN